MRDTLDLESLQKQGINYLRRVRLSARIRLAAVITIMVVSLAIPPPFSPLLSLIFVFILIGLGIVFAASVLMEWQNDAHFRQQKPALIAFLREQYPQMPALETAYQLPSYGMFPIKWKRIFLVLTLTLIALVYALELVNILTRQPISLGMLAVVFWLIYLLIYQMRPKAPPLVNKGSDLLYVKRDYAAAKALITRAKKGTRNPRLWMIESALYYCLGDYAAAETFYWDILAQALTRGTDFQIGSLLNQIAVCCMEQGRYQDAIPLLEWAIRVLPGLRMSYLTLIEVYNRMPDSPDLQRPLEILDGLDSMHAPRTKTSKHIYYFVAGVQRAWALARLGHHAEAREILLPMMQLNKTLPYEQALPIYRNAAAVFEITHDIPEARTLYTFIRNTDPHGVMGREAAERLSQKGT